LTRRINQIQAELISFSTNMVRDRRAAFKNDAKYAESMDDILSLLIKSNDFSDEDLANQTLTMMAAGHETTSSALTWITYLLSKHPEYQTKLRAEIRAALPDPSAASSTITAADIDRLPLLAAVCQETLRLYPTVPVTGRLSVRDTRINDVHIPMNTFVILSPWAINRSTKLWGPNAEEFFPERWINADGTANKTGGATSNYSQITFLHGPRSCIGQDFAGSELKVLCATLIGKFSFELARSEADGQYTPAGVVTTKAKKVSSTILHSSVRPLADAFGL
jgi:cytochrome P450